MPGAIDVEPELPLAYARNITISNNIFVGVGPSGTRRRAVVIDLGGQDAGSTERRGNINVINNYLNATDGIGCFGGKKVLNVSFCGNWITSTQNTMIWNSIDGFIVKDNYFQDCGTAGVGFTSTGTDVQNATISGNTFDTCGLSAAGLQISTVRNLTVSDNSFIDCGGSGDPVAIRLAGGASQFGVIIHDNVFSAPTAVTTTALVSAGTQDALSIYSNNICRDSIAQPTTWQSGFYLAQDGLLSVKPISFAANGDTALYTVPATQRVILSKAVVIAGADAGATTTISIGAAGSTTDFIPVNTLSNLDAFDDAVTLMPVPNTTPTKFKYYGLNTVITATVGSHSGGANNTVLLYGTLYNA
jgi:hypothetical protein